jgi:hypothetical protein
MPMILFKSIIFWLTPTNDFRGANGFISTGTLREGSGPGASWERNSLYLINKGHTRDPLPASEYHHEIAYISEQTGRVDSYEKNIQNNGSYDDDAGNDRGGRKLGFRGRKREGQRQK